MLVGWWPLTEDAGDATDYSGNANHGTVNGASRGAAAPGGITGYSFDATDDLIDVGATNWHIAGTQDFTVSAWFMWDGGNSGEQNGIYTHSDQSSNNPPIGLLADPTNNDITGNVAHSSSSTTFISGGVLRQDEWYHTAIVGDYNSNQLHLYINGRLENTVALTSDIWDVSEDIHFGNWKPQYDDWFGGIICDIRVYDHALTPLEVEALHDNGMVGQPTDGVAKYAFEGDAVDSFGSNDGTVNGATFVDGIRGQAASFDGTDDYIEVSDSPSIGNLSSFTICWWMKTDAADDGRIFAKREGSGDNHGFEVWVEDGNVGSAGEINALLDTSSGTDNVFSTTTVDDGTWHFVTVRWDGSTYDVQIDAGGVEDSASNSGSISDGGTEFDIGGFTALSRPYYEGLIDDFRVYPYALTSRQIQAIYQGWSDVARPKDDGVSYYPLDGNANDAWGSNDGTVNGATEATGLRGRCYSFDGTDDYVDIGDVGAYSAFTVSAWIKIESEPAYSVVTTNQDASDRNIFNWRVEQENDGTTANPSNSIGLASTFSGTVEEIHMDALAGEWQHVVYTFDGITQEGYNNGIRVSSNEPSGTIDTSAIDLHRIGARQNSGSADGHFDGRIDDVRIYDYALNSAEVHALYRWGIGGRDVRKTLVNQ